MEWLQRMNDALDYMEERMETQMEVADIAKRAYVSPFHFQRMFHMVTGMTVAEYIRNRRLTLAAQELAMTSAKVVDVSLKFGYDSPEAFAKAFRRIHGVTPSEARQPGVNLKAFPRITFQLTLKGEKAMEYRIEDKEGFTVLGKALHTSCENNEQTREIPKFWSQCIADQTVQKLSEAAADHMMYGICAEMEAGSSAMTYLIASRVDESTQPGEFETYKVPSGTWAIFPSVGPMPSAIQNLITRIFQEWFPAAGYEHSGGPELEVYLPGDPAAADYYCEVWIPVVKK